MQQQRAEAHRDDEGRARAHRALTKLGIDEGSHFADIYLRYDLSAVASTRSVELLDICFPDEDEILSATQFGRDIYDVPDGYLCLTSGENEAFLLYEVATGQVYDLDVDKLSDLNDGRHKAQWKDFFDLMDWYLTR
jgi:hypothetical protein